MSLRIVEKPCWVVVCDSCGVALDSDDEGSIFHCRDEADARRTAEAYEWRVDDASHVQCIGCWEQLSEVVKEEAS